MKESFGMISLWILLKSIWVLSGTNVTLVLALVAITCVAGVACAVYEVYGRFIYNYMDDMFVVLVELPPTMH